MTDGKIRSKSGFTAVQNTVAKNKHLSLKAKGLYLVIQSYITIPNSSFKKSDFFNMVCEGEKAFERSWNELKSSGYLKTHIHTQNGKFVTEYELMDVAEEGPHTFYYDKEDKVCRTNLDNTGTKVGDNKEANRTPKNGDKVKEDSHTSQNGTYGNGSYGYVIVEANFEIDDRFATRIEKGKTYKLSMDSYNPGIYVDKPVAGNVVTIACSTDIKGDNPGVISGVYLFSPIGSSPMIPESVEINVSDWLSAISLPEGYSFGEYIPDCGYEGCFLISPRVYNKGDESGTPIEWQYSGALTRISADNNQVKITYKNGIPSEILSIPVHNHTTTEHMSVIGLERSNTQWTAIMLKENHDSTGDYWYFWFVKEGADKYYVLSLSADQFSKEEAIEIAKTVVING